MSAGASAPCARAPSDHAYDAALTEDRGARGGAADLWATYAAVRTLHWLGESLADPHGAASFLRGHRNEDGGFAWQRGLRSDVWTAFYCTQALSDLGEDVGDLERLGAWVERLRTPHGGLAMTPGQAPDVWSTYYGVRTLVETCGRPPGEPGAILAWLGDLQQPDGGMTWGDGRHDTDVRAGYYAAVSWRRLRDHGIRGERFDPGALAAWLRGRQTADGGFRFRDADPAPCLWATFRAVAALDALDAEPRDPEACARWIEGRRQPDGGYGRWTGYDSSDVWACFSAVGARRTLRATRWAVRDAGHGERGQVVAFLRSCQMPGTGCSYRPAERAGDALATAAFTILEALAPTPRRAVLAGTCDWLVAAQMPAEGGVMYMPGRGAEARCTLWAAAALALARDAVGGALGALDRARAGRWLATLQNGDGGFGLWEGRGSDMTATAAAVATLATLGLPVATVDERALRCFVEACRDDGGARFAPGGSVTAASTAQAGYTLALLGDLRGARRLADLVGDYRSPLGGVAAAPRGLPDLHSTYQAVLASQACGQPWDGLQVRRLLPRLRRPHGAYSWSPLGADGAGLLPAALGTLLDRASAARAAGGFVAPWLCL